ncbi:MAG TPA: hypothetical protein VFV66_07995, partial [Nonomuraea sp.]|nr:hypothetical protein [Nonomuraea sp.]
IFQVGSVLLALLWLVGPRAGRTRLDGLLGLYLLGTALPLVGLGKVGSNHNHWMEFAAAGAVVATASLWAAAATRWRALAGGLVLALHVGAVVPLVDVTVLKGVWEQRGVAAIAPDAARAAGFAGVVERVRAEPREVIANPLDVIVLAGRPVLLEPYLFSIFHSQGLWSPEPIVERLCTGGVGLVVTNYPLEQFNPAYHDYTHWPAPVYRAMLEAFARESEAGGRFLYVPRSGGPDPAASDGVCARYRG